MQNKFYLKYINGFKYPKTANKVVKEYGEAVKNRNGAIQYNLFSDSLKKLKLQDFEALNWTSGVSSPWVTSYDIHQIGKNRYIVVFHYASGNGREQDGLFMLTLIKKDGVYRIDKIECIDK